MTKALCGKKEMFLRRFQRHGPKYMKGRKITLNGKEMKFIKMINVEKLCFGGSATPGASPPLWPSIFSDYSFLVYHIVNWDDWHLLAHAVAFDFTVAKCIKIVLT
jgi:hypothetical protein